MVPHLLYQIQQLEKIQCSVTHFVTNNFLYYSSVTSMLAQLQWPLHRRCFSKQIIFTKYYIHGLFDINITLAPLPMDTAIILLFCLQEFFFTLNNQVMEFATGPTN